MATKSTQYCIRINYDTGIPEAIKEYMAKTGKPASFIFQEGAKMFLAASGICNADVMQACNANVMQACNADVMQACNAPESPTAQSVSQLCNANQQTVMQPCNAAPTVPTYIPTDPLDIVAEAFYHQPYATLSFHGRGCCDFIADHPIMGPEMVLDAPPEYIKAGIEYMNNPTPVPIYQPKPSENNSKLTEIINTVNSYRAAKDEAFRQSLMEAETLYPDDGDSFFYCDSDDDAQEEVPDYSEEISEEN